ncbi:cation diffusion facilitator family transporter [Microlunatus sp. Y2014]|uniref:cation diffusion facilitator family transporter n=1 Tax=Microlunatus sp. Y2014 TaxID=3418488 RepID=UPI003DA733AC
MSRASLTKFAWLSIAAAIVTITLKTGAWWITGSVGLLSDAAESVVNLVAAVAALIALRVAARPADDDHHFGHAKAEYFSAALEGVMIFIAAAVILVTAVTRFIDPQPIEQVGVGLTISIIASVVNGLVAIVLLRAGRQHNSITLRADGKHLMTDVITSAGVVIGVLLVVLTGWDRLDPVVAFAVGVNIVVTGAKLITESVHGLMDRTLSDDENRRIAAIIARYSTDEVDFHALQTRQSGHQQFATCHVLVPGAWSVTRGHDLVEEVEAAVAEEFPTLHLTTHLEPREDPRAYEGITAEVPMLPAEPDASDDG